VLTPSGPLEDAEGGYLADDVLLFIVHDGSARVIDLSSKSPRELTADNRVAIRPGEQGVAP
jgi:hypothetical protein